MDELPDIIKEYAPISLQELDATKLLERKDTKFIFHECVLPALLLELKSGFRILEINGHRVMDYENQYYDTPDFRFYTDHHNGARTRYKVRYRKYNQPKATYFEIKVKNNKERTHKRRIKVPTVGQTFSEKEKELITGITGVSPDLLSPKLTIHFSRFTLVNSDMTDRITVDFNVRVTNGGPSKHFTNLVIAEIKQPRYRPNSEFIQAMRQFGIDEMRISKYCMGILHTYPGVKYNRFKPKLLRLNKIMSGNSTMESLYA
ncbi:polyphosphate polymerase domain-containing protein [Candidatus Neomarinimicrobiota bacterium]